MYLETVATAAGTKEGMQLAILFGFYAERPSIYLETVANSAGTKEGMQIDRLLRADRMVILKVAKEQDIPCRNFPRKSGIIYIRQCQCEMLPELSVCFMPFRAPGDAIPFSPSQRKQCAQKKIYATGEGNRMIKEIEESITTTLAIFWQTIEALV